MRKIVFFTLFLCLSAAVVVHAQTPDWGSWEGMAYDYVNGIVYQFDSSGGVASFSLPKVDGTLGAVPRYIAVSSDGRYLTYILYDGSGPQGGTPADANMIVYDLVTGTPNRYPFNNIRVHALSYPTSQHIFTPDGTQLAVGYNQPSGWFIAVLDVANRVYGAVLNADSPGAAVISGAPLTYDLPTPVVTNFDGTWVGFVMVPGGGIPLPAALNSFAWNTQTGEVLRTIRFQTLDYDVLPATNEVIQPEQNPLIGTNSAFSFGHNNALAVALPEDARITFYTSEQFNLFSPTFVQNGNKMLFRSDAADGSVSWSTIKRTGGGIGVVSAPFEGVNLGILDAVGTDYGALLITDTRLAAQRLGLPLQGGKSVLHLELRDGMPSTLELVFNAPETAGEMEFIWLRYTASPVVAYDPWADAVQAVVTAPPTATAVVSPGTLAVGRQALVFTTAGDQLNVRSGPGTQFIVVDKLNSGEIVTLVEGPTAANGLTWWRVRTPRNVEGWTVEKCR
jgi:hypothetical protein